jgi:ATP-dependent helicase HrpB
VSERGLGGDDVDLSARLDAWRRDRSQRARDGREMARRWAKVAALSPARGGGMGPGALLALAYPDRVARNRGSGSGAFLLANGRGANVDPVSSLAREPFLAVAELAGTAAQGRIVLAAPIAVADIEAQFADRIESRDEVLFDPPSASLRGRHVRRLGAVALAEQTVKVTPGPDSARALAAGILRLGLDRLPWTKGLAQSRDRVMFLGRAEGADWPDVSDEGLAADPGWLETALAGKTALAELSAGELADAIMGLVPWALRRRLDAEAPTHFAAPTGSRIPIDYAAPEGPKVSVRVQELFGLDRHPAIAGGKVPLVVELLSPAQRPVQVTRDLPGFWRGSYQAVRAEMKGRYPRHPWPDDPLAAPATRRAKRRGT